MTKKLFSGVMLAFMLAATVACSSGAKELEGNDFLVTINTGFGEMKAVLHDETPKHKENFLKLAREGYFDSLLFHRVMSQFMIQGGDPVSKNAAPGQRLGNGGPDYKVDAEILPNFFHKKGAFSAARQGTGNPEKRSSGSQFYIVQGFVHSPEQVQFNQQAVGQCLTKLRSEFPDGPLMTQINAAFEANGQQGFYDKLVEIKDQLAEKTGIEISIPQEQIDAYTTVGGYPSLDGEYTVFGQVIDGLDVLDKIAAVSVDPAKRPLDDVRMFVTVEEMSKEKIAEQFGYDYK